MDDQSEADAYTEQLQRQQRHRGRVLGVLSLLAAPPLIWLGWILPGQGARLLIVVGISMLAWIPKALGLSGGSFGVEIGGGDDD